MVNSTQKSLKTCLRYPGGKSRAIKQIFAYIPDLSEYKQFCEPFMGGASVSIEATKRYPHLDVWVNDLYEPLVNFWQQLQLFGDDLSNTLLEYKSKNNTPDLARDLFNQSKVSLNEESTNSFDRACCFYVINKCSFSGLTESSSFSPQASNSNFSVRGIERLKEFSSLISNWKITNYSYDYLLSHVDRDTFVYLDPPYDIKDNLYGRKGTMHKGFDHDRFAADCDNCNVNQLISYNSDQLVKDRFKDWNTAEFDLTYTMRSVGEYMRDQKQRRELLLFNYGTEGLVELN
jgi:DNA adenine methylase Dam